MMRNECEMVISIRNGNENGGIAIAMENANGKWLGMSCVWGHEDGNENVCGTRTF